MAIGALPATMAWHRLGDPAIRVDSPRAWTVDVDDAGADELALLPGVGPALARRIVEDRAAHGPFGGVDALDRIRGVGPATVDRLRPFVR